MAKTYRGMLKEKMHNYMVNKNLCILKTTTGNLNSTNLHNAFKDECIKDNQWMYPVTIYIKSHKLHIDEEINSYIPSNTYFKEVIIPRLASPYLDTDDIRLGVRYNLVPPKDYSDSMYFASRDEILNLYTNRKYE